jgi:dTMP kinase
MPALLIAIEGIDGSGKNTQAGFLKEHFEAQGKRALIIRYPRYTVAPYGPLISDWLHGHHGDPLTLDPYMASLPYAIDRATDPVLREALETVDVILLDRYVASNMAFQGAKLAERHERETYWRWARELEFGYNNLPLPDFTFVLRVHSEVAQRQIQERIKAGNQLTGKRDLYEQSDSLLSRAAACYEELAELYEWPVIEQIPGDPRAVTEQILRYITT